jgi:hypothetical protein
MNYDINHPIEIFAAKAEAGELGDTFPWRAIDTSTN